MNKTNPDVLSVTTITLRDYFAAHAPDVPEDFPWEQVPRAVKDHDGKSHTMNAREPSLSRTVRWRWMYASLMTSRREA